MAKALIINSRVNIKILHKLISGLVRQNNKIYILSNEPTTKVLAKDNNIPIYKILPWPKKRKWFNSFLLITLAIIYFPFNFIVFLYLKKSKNIKSIVCLDLPEKYIFSPIAKALELKLFWLELPNENNHYKNLLKYYSGWAELLVFTNKQQSILANELKTKKISVLRFGIELKEFQHQENIFSQIAETSAERHNKKFFTVGTVMKLNDLGNTETILMSIKKCLTVIPNIQIIIIGDGPARRDLKWLSRKMEIDNLTWFVGGQKVLKKWFTNFDLYVVSCEIANLNDINFTLHAAAAGLPILAPENIGLDDIISNNSTGLSFPLDDSEILAQKIIYLYKHRQERQKLGRAAQNLVSSNLTLETVLPDYNIIFS